MRAHYPLLLLLALGLAWGGWPRAATAQRASPLELEIRDRGGHPLRGAHVRLEDQHGRGWFVVADSSGQTSIANVPPGPVRVRVSHVGFAPLDSTLSLASGPEARRVRLTLASQASSLPTVSVEAAAPKSYDARRQEGSGFEERRRAGGGVFFTADELRRRGVQRFPDAFRHVPGMRITTRYLVDALESTRQPGCPVAVYMDGVRMHAGSTSVGNIPIESVLAMEVYRGISEIPPAFRPLDRTCGAVLVWTRITVAR